MKKKIMSVMLSAMLVFGTAGTAFGNTGTERGGSGNKDLVNQLQNYIIQYLEKYFENSGNNDSQEETPSISAGEQQKQVVKLVNEERKEAGRAALSANKQLNVLAQMKAEDMAKNNYFSHTSPTYGSAFDMLKQYEVSYKTAGENIARGQKTAQSVMNSWMNSQGHRANILESGYTQIGVGYALSGSGTPYWVQIFAG